MIESAVSKQERGTVIVRVVLQRVTQASVSVDGQAVGAIGRGWLVLICAEVGDHTAHGQRLLDKILKLRAFADPAGKMNLSVVDVSGGLLIVSQFTLAADLTGGNRPSFSKAAPPAEARALYDAFVTDAKARHPLVATGIFAADMAVHLVNDGPVTFILDTTDAERAV
jgi:D-tyrosyl-tRNA(Tyr) deacylase